MCFNKAGKEGCNGGVKSRGKRKSREAGKEEGRREGKCASPPYMELIWFLLRAGPALKSSAPPPYTLPAPKLSLRPGVFPHVEFLLFLDLQSRWLTTPLEHVNRGRSFLTLVPQACWGTSCSLLGERPTEGLDVT